MRIQRLLGFQVSFRRPVMEANTLRLVPSFRVLTFFLSTVLPLLVSVLEAAGKFVSGILPYMPEVYLLTKFPIDESDRTPE